MSITPSISSQTAPRTSVEKFSEQLQKLKEAYEANINEVVSAQKEQITQTIRRNLEMASNNITGLDSECESSAVLIKIGPDAFPQPFQTETLVYLLKQGFQQEKDRWIHAEVWSTSYDWRNYTQISDSIDQQFIELLKALKEKHDTMHNEIVEEQKKLIDEEISKAFRNAAEKVAAMDLTFPSVHVAISADIFEHALQRETIQYLLDNGFYKDDKKDSSVESWICKYF